jgi:predicted enzyme related to lactoylglutathione lyase
MMDPVIHFEFPAEDMARAKTFYEKVFGWEIADSWPTYYFASTASKTNARHFSDEPGVINGALQQRTKAICMPRVIVRVENIDETIKKALEAGAEIFIPKTKLPNSFYCVLHDTEGNEVNILEMMPDA